MRNTITYTVGIDRDPQPDGFFDCLRIDTPFIESVTRL